REKANPWQRKTTDLDVATGGTSCARTASLVKCLEVRHPGGRSMGENSMIKFVTKSVLSLTALSPFTLLHTAPSQAQPYNNTYLAMNGGDFNDCGPSSPCLTLNRALAQTVAGGEIIILNPGFLNWGDAPTTIIKSIHISNDSGSEARFG